MKTIKFQLEDLSCPSCINKIEGVLSNKEGVEDVHVLFHASKVKVQFDADKISPDDIKIILGKLGYPVISQRKALL